MITFPKHTFVGKFLAKEQLYSRDIITGTLKQSLIDDVAKITIEYNFSSRTLNVEEGTVFPEITVLKIVLKRREINMRLLDALDRAIPSSYILFILESDDEQCVSIAHKEKTTTITLSKRWCSEWSDALSLDIRGTTIDQIYRGFIEQVSGGSVSGNSAEQLRDSVANDIERDKIMRQIAKLESKLYNENQLNKQIEIKHEIERLKGKL